MSRLRRRSNTIPRRMEDRFLTPLAPGAVNGTLIEPGPGVRVVVTDTGGKVSVPSAGTLRFTSGTADRDPGLRWGEGTDRTPGRVGLFAFAGGDNWYLGWSYSNTLTAATGDPWVYPSTTMVRLRLLSGSPFAIAGSPGDYSLIAAVQRGAGSLVFAKHTATGVWRLLYVVNVGTNATLRAATMAASGGAGQFDLSRLAVADLPLPLFAPFARDNFAGDGALNARLTNGLGGPASEDSLGAGRVWAAGASWATVGGVAKNTPVPGAELITNGDMEDGDPPSGWNPSNLPVLRAAADERTGGFGVQSLEVEKSGNDYPGAQQAVASTPNAWYSFEGWSKLVAGTNVYFALDGLVTGVHSNLAWVYCKRTVRATGATFWVRGSSNCVGRPVGAIGGRFDDLSLKPLTTADLFAAVQEGPPDCHVMVVSRGVAGVVWGAFCRLDSRANPQNYVLSRWDTARANIITEKIVAGVPTVLATTAATYAADATIYQRPIGDEIRVFYQDALLHTVTVADAGILNNGLHGGFSTDESVTFSRVGVYPAGTQGEWAFLERLNR